VAVEGATLAEPKGGGEKGPKRAPSAFLQLVFQHYRPGSRAIRGVDLVAEDVTTPGLAPGDHYRLGLRLRGDRWVHVLQLGADSSLAVLFPNAEYTAIANPLPGNSPRWVPAEPGWLTLTDTGGAEMLLVIAATEAVPELEELCERHLQAPGPAARREVAKRLATLVASLPRERPGLVDVISFSFEH
jgi:hypothetical protein